MFADKIATSIKNSRSVIVAGLDPVIDSFPAFIIKAATERSSDTSKIIEYCIKSFYQPAFESISGKAAAVKPNIAFFEQYGISGLQVFAELCRDFQSSNIPVIADVKRGDIGSTAQAYSNAYLGKVSIRSQDIQAFNVDAITVNPFLGFDTLQCYIADCEKYKKGLFILVKTSNPGSSDIQDLKSSLSGQAISHEIATWIGKQSEKLEGICGFSGLGAVVGATFPTEAKDLRKLMPRSYFLIPGLGAQGGTVKDALAGLSYLNNGAAGGVLLNVSRGLFSSLPDAIKNEADLKNVIKDRIDQFNDEIRLEYPQGNL